MKKRCSKIFLFLQKPNMSSIKNMLLIVLVLMCLSCDRTSASQAQKNLALQKPYRFSVAPNYPLCTDQNDSIQITDGHKAGSIWGNKSTVGWKNASSPPEIIIDLKKQVLVTEIRVYTVGGGHAQVEYPKSVVVFLSSDGRDFSFIALKRSKGLPAGKKPYVCVIDNITCAARYVKVVISPDGYYTFLDEIEVFGKDDNKAVSSHTPKEGPGTMDDVQRQFQNQSQLCQALESTVKLIKNNRQRIDDDLCRSALIYCRDAIANIPNPDEQMLSQERFVQLEHDLGKRRALIFAELYHKPFVCFSAYPTKPLLKSDLPDIADGPLESIEVRSWQNEYESFAVNVVNCELENIKLIASASPLTGPDGKIINSDDVITIRQAAFARSLNQGLTGDALVLHKQNPLHLAPGQIGQFWFSLHSLDLKAGKYKGMIAVIADSASQDSLPEQIFEITLDVAPLKFPTKASLRTYNWAYPELTGVTRKHINATADDLKKHYTNVFIINHKLIPFPITVSDSGNIQMPSFRILDGILENNNYSDMYLFWFGFNPGWKDARKFGNAWMSSAWKRAYRTWLEKLIGHLRQKGVGYDDFALYPFDESLCDGFYDLVRLTKLIDPEIKIFANSFGKGPSEFNRSKDLVDIWCLPEGMIGKYPHWAKRIQKFGSIVWRYGGTYPAKEQGPNELYRLMPWRAFSMGQTGAGFWVYADPVSSTLWDDTVTTKGYYGVVYGVENTQWAKRGESIIPSRRWQAWRQGVEDYEYLAVFQKAIDELKSQQNEKATDYQHLLKTHVRNVLQNPDDLKAVENARQAITNALIELNLN